jgi:WD40 repeat protein
LHVKYKHYKYYLDKINNPVYIYNNIPLSTWNIAFKKSISLEAGIVTAIIVLPDLDTLVTGDNFGNITFWKITGYNLIYTKNVHKSDITGFCYLFNEKTLFTGSSDYISKITFNSEHNKYTHAISEKVDGPIVGLCSAMDGDKLISGVNNNLVYWDIETCSYSNQVEISEDSANVITSLLLVPELRLALIGLKNSMIKFYNPYEESIIFTIDNSHNLTPVKSMTTCLMDDYLVLCSTGEDLKLNFWNLEQKSLLRTEIINSNPIQISYCNDSKTLFMVNNTGIITLYNYLNKQKKDFFTRKIPFICGAYLGDGNNFITSCVDSSLEFYGSKSQ